MGFISNTIDKITGGKDAAKASKQGAEEAAVGMELAGDERSEGILGGSRLSALGQQDAMQYLQGQNEIDRAGSQNAKRRIMGLYGLEGGTGSQQGLIDQAQNSPLYAAMQGTRQAGEDAIMRNAAATGGLRSGNVQSNMYDYNQRLDERSLLESYDQQLQGLEGMAGWQTNESEIGQYLAGIKDTQGQGIQGAAGARADALAGAGEARGLGTVGAGQAIQSGRGGLIDTAGTIAGGAKWSDPKLKDNVTLLADVDGHNIYEWTWNRLAESLGLFGYDTGVMASEIEQTHPWAVGMSQGYQTVNYDMLGV